MGTDIPNNVEEIIESCWKELWEKKTDSRFSPEILEENQNLLTEITILVEAFLSNYIGIDKLRMMLRRFVKSKDSWY
ncbi:MAG: hypothetical protein ACETWM_09240 [Candidatus Lokiarchaeia archaeon]